MPTCLSLNFKKMPKQVYEIEIKSLLGSKENAEKLKQAMQAADPQFKEMGSHKQLNHYFEGGNLKDLAAAVSEFLELEKKAALHDLAERAKDFSVRTRWADGTVILVVKASVDDTTSSNGTARIEWEAKVNKTIEELDQLVLQAGFKYQAKWSRERSEYQYKGANVSIDKNAGYGYLSEFEMVVGDQNQADQTKALLRQMMQELGLLELPQDRLARMFDFYNKNWEKYYGTENTFTIE